MTSTIGLSTDSRPRWRVAILGAHDESLAALKAAVIEAGGQVMIEAPPRADSLGLLAHAPPEVLILHPPRVAGQRPDLTTFASVGYPVVLFTRDTSRALLKLAAAAGVSAFLVEPLQAAQLAPTLDLAIARFGDSEVLRRKLADRKIIERAKGRLMAILGIPEDEAFRRLRTQAMQRRSTLGDVARSVMTAGAGIADPMAPDDRQPARRIRAAPPSPGRFARSPSSLYSRWRTVSSR